eukprot:g66476.t1
MAIPYGIQCYHMAVDWGADRPWHKPKTTLDEKKDTGPLSQRLERKKISTLCLDGIRLLAVNQNDHNQQQVRGRGVVL